MPKFWAVSRARHGPPKKTGRPVWPTGGGFLRDIRARIISGRAR